MTPEGGLAEEINLLMLKQISVIRYYALELRLRLYVNSPWRADQIGEKCLRRHLVVGDHEAEAPNNSQASPTPPADLCTQPRDAAAQALGEKANHTEVLWAGRASGPSPTPANMVA